MENAMWLGSIFGPLLLIMGIWILSYAQNVVKILASVKNSPAAFWMTGFVNLLVGLTIISLYNYWMANLAFLVTLLGWVMFLRGLLVFFFPKVVFMTLDTRVKTVRLWGLLPLIWGFGLCWLSFFA